MKKTLGPALGLGLLAVFVGLLLAETLVVKVQSTNIRKNPKFYAPVVAALKAGDKVEKVGSQEGWFQVKTPKGLTGWLHSSAVQAGKVDLLASDRSLQTGASTGEVALAAKGFNKDVEGAFKARHAGLDYAWVERMLEIRVPPAEVEQFMKQGKLGEFGGPK